MKTTLTTVALSGALLSGQADAQTSFHNKEIINSLYTAMLNGRHLEAIDTIVDDHYTGPGGTGRSGFAGPVKSVLNALPDAHWTILDLVAEGEKVVVRWKLEGTHTGPFQSITPHGARIQNEGMAIYTFASGKIITHSVITDRIGFLQQLGVLPVDLSAIQKKASAGKSVYFIDKFFIPVAAKAEFHDRMQKNRTIICKLSGFIEDHVYEYPDHKGNLICITVAMWDSSESLSKARQIVQDEYRKEGFDPQEMMDRLGIVVERGTYLESKQGSD